MLLDADQRQLAPDGSDSRAGEDVASIVLQHSNGSSRCATTLARLLAQSVPPPPLGAPCPCIHRCMAHLPVRFARQWFHATMKHESLCRDPLELS